MTWQDLTLIGMFLFALLYIATLYHLAHGRERKAVKLGATLVMEALARDGRIMSEPQPHVEAEPVNLGEEDFDVEAPPNEMPQFPDILLARSEEAARQMAEKIGKF